MSKEQTERDAFFSLLDEMEAKYGDVDLDQVTREDKQRVGAVIKDWMASASQEEVWVFVACLFNWG